MVGCEAGCVDEDQVLGGMLLERLGQRPRRLDGLESQPRYGGIRPKLLARGDPLRIQAENLGRPAGAEAKEYGKLDQCCSLARSGRSDKGDGGLRRIFSPTDVDIEQEREFLRD